ncbi:hypothetical protein [Psychrobacillus phage Perkons]|nr:hypothetical protein [Psychrobacillus phage Perkons]
MGKYFETKHDALYLTFKEHEEFEGKMVIVDESDTPYLWIDKETGEVSFGGKYFLQYKEQRLLETLLDFVYTTQSLMNNVDIDEVKEEYVKNLLKFEEIQRDFAIT